MYNVASASCLMLAEVTDMDVPKASFSVAQLVPSLLPSIKTVPPDPKVPKIWMVRSAQSGRWKGEPLSPLAKVAQVPSWILSAPPLCVIAHAIVAMIISFQDFGSDA